MSGQDNVLDPRLGASTLNESAQHPLPPPFSAVSSEKGAQSSPQPYYHYPSPHTTHTPRQPSAVQSVSGVSNQDTPEENQSYAVSDGAARSPDAGEDAQGEDAKRPRACEACRGLKVRCDQDPEQPDIPCKRCAKAGRQCIITQPSRKRQKKADSRVAELERKLDALTAVLQQQQHAPPQYGTSFQANRPAPTDAFSSSGPGFNAQYQQRPNSSSHEIQSPWTHVAGHGQKRKRSRDEVERTPSLDAADEPVHYRLKTADGGDTRQKAGNHWDVWEPNNDLRRYLYHTTPEEFVNRINSLIQPNLAATIFDRYVTKLAPHCPAVVFPAGTTAAGVFKNTPILYVCILSAASHGMLHPDTSKQITREAIGAIADCVVRNGAKSLELIQAMQVIALWYRPPEKAEQTNFYQIIHMAAVMALDIGLGKRFNPAKARRGFGGPGANFAPGPGRIMPQDSDTLEARRAWLCCYLLCASASMILRRANLVRWTNYMRECIEVLETHPDAAPSDKLFCQHIKIQHICEDIGLQFLMDDNTANISITDPKVTYALNVLESQLKSWKENIPAECRVPELQFFEHVTSLYLHEIALHFNHNVEDFRLPFTEESLKSVNNTSDTLTQSQMAALEACLKAAHGILDTMMAFDLQTVRNLPMLIFFVRCVYAIVILIKMHVAVCSPNSEMGKIMKPEDLRVDEYMDGLITMFGRMTAEDQYRSHPKILRILNLLNDWFGKHKETVTAQRRGDSTHLPANGAGDESQKQTPLHLLSQVATSNQQLTSESAAANSSSQNWTFDSPGIIDYTQRLAPDHPDNRMPVHQQNHPPPTQQAAAYETLSLDQGMVDPANPNFGWGSGFEQAMDIALGGMDGLQGGGLDGWFLGDSMAPFGFNGELTATGQQQWG